MDEDGATVARLASGDAPTDRVGDRPTSSQVFNLQTAADHRI